MPYFYLAIFQKPYPNLPTKYILKKLLTNIFAVDILVIAYMIDIIFDFNLIFDVLFFIVKLVPFPINNLFDSGWKFLKSNITLSLIRNYCFDYFLLFFDLWSRECLNNLKNSHSKPQINLRVNFQFKNNEDIGYSLIIWQETEVNE